MDGATSNASAEFQKFIGVGKLKEILRGIELIGASFGGLGGR